jgi:hypothetical protein
LSLFLDTAAIDYLRTAARRGAPPNIVVEVPECS